MTNKTSISEFYSGKKIFITGATGFIGKILLWKLLRSCPLIDTIYILIRAKRGKTAATRLEELLTLCIFDEFRTENPSVLKKVIAIQGDTSEPQLGLDKKDKKCLAEDVSIVFHGAADLRMNASLKDAFNVNTEGTQRMLDLALEMKNLHSFVYVSTAFCCCDSKVVEEKLYPMRENPGDISNLTRSMNDNIIAKITPRIIAPLPNTYIYTKRLTEILLSEYQTKLPIIVARPTIVFPCMTEPASGFIDNMNGPIGVCIAVGKGVIRSLLCSKKNLMDVIPADIVCNGLIVVPWVEFAFGHSDLNRISVYNLSHSGNEPFTYETLEKNMKKIFLENPFKIMLWYPDQDNFFTTNKFVHGFKRIFYDYLPAYLIDSILILVKQKPFLVKVQNKLSQGQSVFTYFTTNQWIFKNDNIRRANQLMTESDRRTFPLIMENLDYFTWGVNSTKWIKKLVIKEDNCTPAECRRRVTIMYIISWIFSIIFYVVLAKLLLACFHKLF